MSDAFNHLLPSKDYKLPNNIILIGCYHPSPRNVNTKRITLRRMTSLFLKAKNLSL